MPRSSGAARPLQARRGSALSFPTDCASVTSLPVGGAHDADSHSVEGFGESVALDGMLCSKLARWSSQEFVGAIGSHEDGKASEPLSPGKPRAALAGFFAPVLSAGPDFA